MYLALFLFLYSLNIAGGRTLSGGLSSRLTTETKSDSFTKTASGSNGIPNSYLPTTQQAPTHIPSSKQSPEKSKMPENESQMISVRYILYFVSMIFYNINWCSKKIRICLPININVSFVAIVQSTYHPRQRDDYKKVRYTGTGIPACLTDRKSYSIHDSK